MSENEHNIMQHKKYKYIQECTHIHIHLFSRMRLLCLKKMCNHSYIQGQTSRQKLILGQGLHLQLSFIKIFPLGSKYFLCNKKQLGENKNNYCMNPKIKIVHLSKYSCYCRYSSAVCSSLLNRVRPLRGQIVVAIFRLY